MPSVLRTMIVPVASVATTRQVCALLAGEAGQGMFTAAISESGKAPATHYISSGLIDEYFAEIMASSSLKNIIAAAGLELSQSEVDSIIGTAIISEEPPHVVLEANNLKLIGEV